MHIQPRESYLQMFGICNGRLSCLVNMMYAMIREVVRISTGCFACVNGVYKGLPDLSSMRQGGCGSAECILI